MKRPNTLPPNTRIADGRYLILRDISTGGQGTVYEAIDLRFDRPVAVKEMRGGEQWSAETIENEGRILAKLKHRALPQVFDYFMESGRAYLIMEFVSGDNLQILLKRRGRAFSLEVVVNWANELLDAVAHMHSQKEPIIHRDINPRNLILDDSGHLILVDFGIAKIKSVGTVIDGTSEHFSPPEQRRAVDKGTEEVIDETDVRSDLYSLAATLYYLMTNEKPTDSRERYYISVFANRPDPLPPPNELNSQVPAQVASVLVRAMSLNRDQRPNSADLMRQELQEAFVSHKRGVQMLAAPGSLMPNSDLQSEVRRKIVNRPDPVDDITKIRPRGLEKERMKQSDNRINEAECSSNQEQVGLAQIHTDLSRNEGEIWTDDFRELLEVYEKSVVNHEQIIVPYNKQYASSSKKILAVDMPKGFRINGKVVGFVGFGAIVEIEPGIEGYIDPSDITYTRYIRKASEFLNVGQEVQAVVIDIEISSGDIYLSMADLEPYTISGGCGCWACTATNPLD